MSTVENNKRIVRNTLMLYIRMFLVMGVSLYTTRIVLSVLGVEDFGIYNVVAGFVSMFVFLNGALSAATSRFLSFELGKKEYSKLESIFKTSFTIHFFLALAVFLVLIVGGFWMLNTKLVIPEERMKAANVVFLFSSIGAVIGIIQVPFSATIIANEKMKIYAYVGIFDVVIRLILVFLLKVLSYDKLITYSFLMLSIVVSIFFIYLIYCKRSFKECKVAFLFRRDLLKSMLTYSGWSFIGSFAAMIKNQGINVLINLFFGPAVNAARGIAFQVNNALGQFAQNFIIASNPQIIKYYASNEVNPMVELVMNVAKFSFFLMLLIGIPFILEADFILSIWLVEIPEYAAIFLRLIIINLLLESFTYPMGTSVQATGRIKLYQMVVGGTITLNLPITYVCFKAGLPPQSSILVSIGLTVVSLFFRLILIKKEIPQFKSLTFATTVFLKSFIVACLSFVAPYMLYTNMEMGFVRFFVVGISGVVSTALFIFLIGVNKKERQFMLNKVTEVLKLGK
nr:MATE family efflux transporter [uncultured Carboxylicivirga sp.]